MIQEELIPPKKDHILPILKKELPNIFLHRPVVLAYLHGSMVDDQAIPGSDVDIALVIDPEVEITAYAQTMMELDIAYEVQLSCKIREADVRCINKAPLTVQGKVLTHGILLYSRNEPFRVEYEVSTRMRYFDYQPIEKQMHAVEIERLSKRE